MPSGNTVAITISASVDSSFAASTKEAAAQIDKLAASAKSAHNSSADAANSLVSQARQQISQINADPTKGNAERIVADKQVWDQLLANAQLSSAQIARVHEEMARSETEAAKRAAEEQRRISQSNAETAQRMAEVGFGGQKKALQDEVETHQITKQQELTQLIAIAGQEENIRQKALTDAETGFAQDSAYFIEQENKKKIAAAESAQEIESLRRQLTDADNQENQKQAQNYRGMLNQITSAEGELVNDIFTKRQKLSRDLAQIGEKMLEQEVSSDLKYGTQVGLNAVLPNMFEAPKGGGGGLLSGIMGLINGGGGQAGAGGAAVGGAAQAGTQTANATAITANTSIITGALVPGITALTTALTSHGVVVATNTVSTSANTVGTAANTVGTTANTGATVADATSTAANATSTDANTLATIGNTLAQWASDAGDFISKLIPFDEGTPYVPRTMPALIHQGEMIVPAGQAAAMRSGTANFGAIQASTQNYNGGDTYHMNVTHAPTINAPQGSDLAKLVREQPGALVSAIQGLVRGGYLKMA